jgi:hypothetical protein
MLERLHVVARPYKVKTQNKEGRDIEVLRRCPQD